MIASNTGFVGVVPARGGSKGVPRKNIRMVAGKPLIAWTIEAALTSAALALLVVSTDDEEIADTSRQFGARVIMRPAELAADRSPTLPVLRHAADVLTAEGIGVEAVVTLQPTSPLRRPRHLEEAVALFRADPLADSLVSTVEVPHIFHPQSLMAKDEQGYLRPYQPDGPMPLRRQEKPALFARNGAAVYITRANRLDDFVFGGRLISYPMSLEDSLDVDTEEDLREADRLLRLRA